MSLELVLPENPWWSKKEVITDAYPKQKEIFDDPTQWKVVCGGARAGKTILLHELCIKHSINAPIKQAKSWIVAPDWGGVKDTYWDDLFNRIKFLGYDKKNPKVNRLLLDYNERDKWIKIRNKLGGFTTISLKSAEAETKLIGASIQFLGIDEMWKIHRRVFTQHLEQRAKGGNAKVIIISTSNGEDFFHDLWQLGNKQSTTYNPKWKSWILKTYDNPLYSKEYIEESKKNMTTWEYSQQYEASFDIPTGRVYLNFDYVTHVKENLQIDLNAPLYMTWDFNTTPMTTSICQIRPGNEEYQNLITKKKKLMEDSKNLQLTDEQRVQAKEKLPIISQLVAQFPIKEQKEVLYVLKTFYENNTDSEKQSTLIKQWLNSIGWTNKILIYGDATGGARASATDKTNWSNIRYAFQDWISYHEYGSSNPDPVDRINSVNLKLMNADNEVGMYFDANECKPLIKDLQHISRKENGEVDKNRAERMGMNHAVEGLGYLIHKRLKQVNVRKPASFII